MCDLRKSIKMIGLNHSQGKRVGWVLLNDTVTVILTNVLTCSKILISDHMGMIIQILMLLQTESI